MDADDLRAYQDQLPAIQPTSPADLGPYARFLQSMPDYLDMTQEEFTRAVVLVKSVTIAYRETEVQSVTSLIQLPRRWPRVPPSPQGVGSSFPFDAPADHKLKYSQLHRVLPCEAKSSLRVTVVLMRSCFSSWT